MAKINIGRSSALDYLDQQVSPAYGRFRDIPSRENAIGVATALWETTGWLWSDRHPGVDRRKNKPAADAFDADLFKRCPDLKLIRDIADTAKHGGELNRKDVVVTGISGSGRPGGRSETFTPYGNLQSTPARTLRIAPAFGESRAGF